MYKNHFININGTQLSIRDLQHSCTVPIVARELNEGDYNLSGIGLQPGDVVVDIGANVGTTAIYITKKFPGLIVYAYEPVWENYINLVHNRLVNGAANVHCVHGAIGPEYGLVDVVCNTGNTGGSYTKEGESYVCYSLTEVLEQLNARHGKKVKLLKVDCEGQEKIIFTKDYTSMADYLSIETHGDMPEDVLDNINKFSNRLWLKKA